MTPPHWILLACCLSLSAVLMADGAEVCGSTRISVSRMDGLGVQVTSQMYAHLLVHARQQQGYCYAFSRPHSVHHWADYGGSTEEESISILSDHFGWSAYDTEQSGMQLRTKARARLTDEPACAAGRIHDQIMQRQSDVGCTKPIDLWVCAKSFRAQVLGGSSIHNVTSTLRAMYWINPKTAPPQHADPSRIHVALHVRRGDVMSDKKHKFRATPLEAYARIMDTFRTRFQGSQQFHLYSEGDPADFELLVGPDVQLHLGGDALATFHAFVTADYLVIGASTFSWSAAILRQRQDTVILPNGLYFSNYRLPPGWTKVKSTSGPLKSVASLLSGQMEADITAARGPETVLPIRSEFRIPLCQGGIQGITYV